MLEHKTVGAVKSCMVCHSNVLEEGPTLIVCPQKISIKVDCDPKIGEAYYTAHRPPLEDSAGGIN